jgi:hypothetical protein
MMLSDLQETSTVKIEEALQVLHSKRKSFTRSVDVILFSTAKTTPSFVFNPTAVEPSCKKPNNSCF